MRTLAPFLLALVTGCANVRPPVDVSIIPETLIQNVEAVTGGASAAYGADAVAGVVNFRLNRSPYSKHNHGSPSR